LKILWIFVNLLNLFVIGNFWGFKGYMVRERLVTSGLVDYYYHLIAQADTLVG